MALLTIQVPDGREYPVYPVPDPIPEGAITENSRCVFHLRGDGFPVFGVDLTIDDIPLERVAESPSHVRWRWEPGFHAGTAEVCLRNVTPSPAVFELITDPARAKLTRREFLTMVHDIIEDTSALVALAGLRTHVSQGNCRPTDFARFEYLRSCFMDMENAVRAIDRSPWSRLERTARTVPVGRCSGATALELSRAARTARPLLPEELARLGPVGRRLSDRLGQRLPRTVEVSRARVDHRRREHAEVLGCMRMWRGFLGTVQQRLLRTGEEHGLPAAKREVLLRQCGGMIRRLADLERLPVFERVTPAFGPVRSSHLFSRVDQYRRFYRAYLGFLAGLGSVEGEFLQIPLRRTFELYELWCFLRLVRAAADREGPSGGYRDAFSEVPDRSGLLLVLRGKPFRFRGIILLYKPVYREVWRSDGPTVGSFSRRMIPDIAIESENSLDDHPEPVIVLDAKYRIETEIDNAVLSIHTYRDALVRQSTAGPRRTVEAAFVLSPHILGSDPLPDAWQDDQAPRVFFRDGYRDRYRFGAVTMRPGISLAECRNLLERLEAMIYDGGRGRVEPGH